MPPAPTRNPLPAPARQDLGGSDWSVRAVGDLHDVPDPVQRTNIRATVPGCVHLDLIQAALIGDPTVGTNETEQQWIGLTDWEFRREFHADEALFAHERIDLVFDGLDTIATVTLNGTAIGAAANMFHPHRFDVRAALRRGPNELVVRFASPVRHIRSEAARLGPRPVNGDWDCFVFIRKAACNFGWDWGPKAATSGIWQPVRLEAWSVVRLHAVRASARRVSGDDWSLDAVAELEWASTPKQPLRLDASLADADHVLAQRAVELNCGAREARLELAVTAPDLWWPRGYGEQKLHSLSVSLTDPSAPDGTRENWHAQIGFREVRLDTSTDHGGSRFTVVVNDKPILCKGANWIPEGPYAGHAPHDVVRSRLAQAAEANMNMLRVWGGGVYESTAFYEECDRLGLMVWQDFMFACGMYPEEDSFPRLIEEEARHQIARLSAHPSVMLWCGGNECLWAYENWGWKEKLAPGQTWGSRYWLDLLPRVCAELDPSRPYWANSPWSGDEATLPNDPHRGDRHTWDVDAGWRGAEKPPPAPPRFCSEFGQQAPSNYTTIADALGTARLTLGSPELERRQLGPGGSKRWYDEPLASWFRPPRDFDEWHYLTQLVQARFLAREIEWMRVHQPRCMGALLWQLNDAWPGHSWSIIDSGGGGRPKPAWHAVKHAFQRRLLTIQPTGVRGEPEVWCCNDTDEEWSNVLDVRRMGLDGTVHRAAARTAFVVPPRSVRRLTSVASAVGLPDDPTSEFIVADTIKRRASWFFAPDKELRYVEPRFEHEISYKHPAGAVAIRATSVLRDVVVVLERTLRHPIHITRELPNLVLPGEQARTSFWGALNLGLPQPTVDLSGTAEQPLLWCANMFTEAPPAGSVTP